MKKLITLLLVLTGMVSTANAWTTVKLLNSVEGTWDSSATTTMTNVGDGSNNFFYYILDGSTVTDTEGNYYFRIYVSDNTKQYGAWENNFEILDYTNYGGKESQNSFKLVTDKSSKYIISVGYWEVNNEWKWYFTATKYYGTGTITFVNTSNFSKPCAYVYCTGEARLTGGWPGTEMTANADGTYTLSSVNIGANSKVIISDNGSSQIADQTFNEDMVIDGDGLAAAQTVAFPSGEKYATFSSKYPLTFDDAADADVKAYKASVGTNVVNFTRVTGVVPANTGLFVQRFNTESTPSVAPAATATADVSGNLLKPTTGVNIYDNTKAQYVFAKQDGQLAFYKVISELSPDAGKAYLETNSAISSARLGFAIDNEEVTGINLVSNSESKVEGFYNLNGQRVAQPTKGLYIVNGKKYIVK